MGVLGTIILLKPLCGRSVFKGKFGVNVNRHTILNVTSGKQRILKLAFFYLSNLVVQSSCMRIPEIPTSNTLGLRATSTYAPCHTIVRNPLSVA